MLSSICFLAVGWLLRSMALSTGDDKADLGGNIIFTFVVIGLALLGVSVR